MLASAKISLILYILAVFFKGLGLILSGTSIFLNWDYGTLSLFTNGLPDYIIATSYCFIFFSWCSVCATAFAHKQKSFFIHSSTVLKVLITAIWIGFIVSVILMFSTNATMFHHIEGCIASVRDFAISFAFIFYLYNVIKLFDNACCNFKTPESRLFILCIVLMVALLYRGCTIQVYTWYFSNYSNSQTMNVCSFNYFSCFVCDQILVEAIPLFFVGLQRCFTPKEREVSSGTLYVSFN